MVRELQWGTKFLGTDNKNVSKISKKKNIVDVNPLNSQPVWDLQDVCLGGGRGSDIVLSILTVPRI